MSVCSLRRRRGVLEVALPRLGIHLLEFDLMRNYRRPPTIEDEETRAGGSLVDRSNIPLLRFLVLCLCHVGSWMCTDTRISVGRSLG